MARHFKPTTRQSDAKINYIPRTIGNCSNYTVLNYLEHILGILFVFVILG